jgi:hypothetical protein
MAGLVPAISTIGALRLPLKDFIPKSGFGLGQRHLGKTKYP